jgi:hypothetical protein
MMIDHLERLVDQFERLGKIYKVQFLEPSMKRFENIGTDAWDALAFFLSGYAFERQGRSPSYAHAAEDAIFDLKKEGHKLTDKTIEKKVWERFRKLLHRKGLNEFNNPLSPKGTSFKLKNKKGEVKDLETRGISVVEFVQKLPNRNLVVWAKKELKKDKADKALERIKRITGVKDKIASLFLRDIAVIYDLHLKKCDLLQPVDIWVLRIIRIIEGDPSLEAKECPEWIVRKSKGCRKLPEAVNPEAVNQGMWYWASQVAKSEYRLEKILEKSRSDLDVFANSVREHLSTLQSAASLAKDWQ